jgi:hypothetical protein
MFTAKMARCHAREQEFFRSLLGDNALWNRERNVTPLL